MMRPIRLDVVLFPPNERDLNRSRLSLTALMQGLALHNKIWLQFHPNTPRLYDTRVVYKPEKNTEHWCDIPTVLAKGYGDCEDLACWRLGELLAQGIQAEPYITWRQEGQGAIYHALVRWPDGRIEDPSRALGMRHPIVRRPVFLTEKGPVTMGSVGAARYEVLGRVRKWAKDVYKKRLNEGRKFFSTPTPSRAKRNAWQFDKKYKNSKGFIPAWMKATGASRQEAENVYSDIRYQKWLYSVANYKSKQKGGKKAAMAWTQATMQKHGINQRTQDAMMKDLFKTITKHEKGRGVTGALRQAKNVVNKVAKVAKQSLTAAAKLAGPAIATVFPPAAGVIDKGLKLLDSAQKGVVGAIDKVQNIAEQAKLGDPTALKALDALKAAKVIQDQVRGNTPPAPGALIIDRARLVEATSKQGLVLLDPKR